MILFLDEGRRDMTADYAAEGGHCFVGEVYVERWVYRSDVAEFVMYYRFAVLVTRGVATTFESRAGFFANFFGFDRDGCFFIGADHRGDYFVWRVTRIYADGT